jgi:hypothetical protein
MKTEHVKNPEKISELGCGGGTSMGERMKNVGLIPEIIFLILE